MYRLYIRIKMRDILVEKQIQWILSYVQRRLGDIQNKNIIEDLESRSLSYTTVGKFLSELKKEFGSRNNETMKVAELKKVEQESKMMEKFVQKFRRAARRSRYCC